ADALHLLADELLPLGRFTDLRALGDRCPCLAQRTGQALADLAAPASVVGDDQHDPLGRSSRVGERGIGDLLTDLLPRLQHDHSALAEQRRAEQLGKLGFGHRRYLHSGQLGPGIRRSGSVDDRTYRTFDKELLVTEDQPQRGVTRIARSHAPIVCDKCGHFRNRLVVHEDHAVLYSPSNRVLPFSRVLPVADNRIWLIQRGRGNGPAKPRQPASACHLAYARSAAAASREPANDGDRLTRRPAAGDNGANSGPPGGVDEGKDLAMTQALHTSTSSNGAAGLDLGPAIGLVSKEEGHRQ